MRAGRAVYAALTLAVLLSFSCTAENEKLEYAGQENLIEQFTASALREDENRRIVNENGCIRIVLSEGDGETPGSEGLVSFIYAGYVFTGGSALSSSQMFATNDRKTAEEAGWDSSDSEAFNPVTVSLSDGRLVTGLRYGLRGVKPGEECIVIFSGKYGFGNRQSGMIPAKSALAYHIRVTGTSR